MNFAEFLNKIQTYESDTFNGIGSLMTNDEKIKIGNKLLDQTFEELDGSWAWCYL